MKIVTIIGARPQFIKSAVVSREIRKKHIEVLVHTGQHYNANMSNVFFKELALDQPDYNLAVGSASHGRQTGEMLAGIEDVLYKENPKWVLVYGDTNSTLAGALAAAKLNIKIAHVEAGLRSFNRKMPEEINRIVTDHISDALFTPSQTAMDNLRSEGIITGLHLVGDVMYDALLWAIENNPINAEALLTQYNLKSKNFLLLTVHRADNTDNLNKLAAILEAAKQIKQPIIWPIHPRTKKQIQEYQLKPADNIHMIEPIGYFEMLILQSQARYVLTDSGGMQKESYWLNTPCITLRDETEWVETVQVGWNILTGANPQAILEAVQHWEPETIHPPIYGDGTAAQKINQILSNA